MIQKCLFLLFIIFVLSCNSCQNRNQSQSSIAPKNQALLDQSKNDSIRHLTTDSLAIIDSVKQASKLYIWEPYIYFSTMLKLGESKDRGQFETDEEYRKRQPEPIKKSEIHYLIAETFRNGYEDEKYVSERYSYNIKNNKLTIKGGEYEIKYTEVGK